MSKKPRNYVVLLGEAQPKVATVFSKISLHVPMLHFRFLLFTH